MSEDAHRGWLMSGEVTCSCGWESGHYALASNAADAFDKHLSEALADGGSAVARYKRYDQCLPCGKRIGWTGTTWVHVESGLHTCIPTTYADPGT